jgi:valyl-tRNA synthetase
VNSFPAYDPAEAEPRLQAACYASGLYRVNPHDSQPIFAVDTPPPTVSGAIHIGHVYSRSLRISACGRRWRPPPSICAV